MPFNRSYLRFFLLCLLLGISAGRSLAFPAEQGIRIDLPQSGHLRVENQFGAVSAEIWNEKQVYVSADIEGGATFKRSPVVIENRGTLVMISIIRTPIDPPVKINLTIKIPATGHAEIITREGAVSLRGLASSSSIKTDNGDIRVELVAPLDADITARTIGGLIRSELAAPITADGHQLLTRIGAGTRVLNLNSARGEITLKVVEATAGASDDSKPTLVGTEAMPGAGVPADPNASEEVSEGDVIRVDSQLVNLNISVVDRTTSRGLSDLRQTDFRLFEDGTEQAILQFESASAPFDLILLIDLSGSTREVVNLIKAAALRFVAAARPSDRIGVITFAGQPTIASELTLDKTLLAQRVNVIETAAGDTKLYDALDFTISQLAKSGKSTRRQAIVLMSDGLDGTIPGVSGQQGSKLPYKELLDHVSEFEGVLYTLWLNTEYEALSPLDTQPEAFDMGHDRMKELAENGGGVFYEVERLQDLAGIYEQVVRDLGTVYTLAYRPSNKTRDGSWRAIKVMVNRASAVPRARRGYYAN